MKEDSTTRRNVLKGVAAALTAGAAGCSAPTSQEESYSFIRVSEGDYLEVRDTDTVEVEEVYKETGQADLEFVAGPPAGNYSEGDGVLCDQTGEEHVGVYVEEINYEEEEVKFRLEQDSEC